MMEKMNLPESLTPLKSMAMNYYWSWHQNLWPLYEKLNPQAWQQTRNPVATLLLTDKEKLEDFSNDNDYLKELNQAYSKFEDYMSAKNTWYQSKYSQKDLVAYFSAEFGIHESLPIYSGGLGVLSGDHVKASSDLGIPMVFMGLFYKEGYFIQHIDGEGSQVDEYEFQNPQKMSLELVKKEGTQEPLIESVRLADREVYFQVWKAQVGRNPLYLLDTNLTQNKEADQELTARLYGGDREMRISQEIILGIGGVRVLEALNLNPTAFHMNEGHSGFFQLERVLNEMKKFNLSFEEAKVVCSSNCVFTTHTPVPAGNETFDLALVHKYFYSYVKELNISWHRFLSLGLVSEKTDYKYFSLTIFALNFSRFYNGVSELHGQIAKKMWRNLWENVPEVDNPISHVTNGVHVPTWMSQPVKDLISKNMSENWQEHLSDDAFWTKVQGLPNEEVRATKKDLKEKMIQMARHQLKEQLQRNGENETAVTEVDQFLKNDVLTIGFARRFATYKRATLIFKDEKKLAEIVNHPTNPVQFLFAGKAHPADKPGQAFIRDIYKISRKPEFKGKVIILENYDMNISRHMVSGVDVWLNNPRRPLEASGTSGQKVPINLGLNFSVLDGWWREGYDGKNGWTIGKEKDYPSDEVQDFEDAHDFYKTLSEVIVPLYYGANSSHANSSQVNLESSTEWIEKTKVSFETNVARFSTNRMVKDYMNLFYAPAIEYGEQFRDSKEDSKKGSKKASENLETYIKNRRFLQRNWEDLTVQSLEFSGSTVVAPSKYDQYKGTPSHHTDFPVDDTFPGQVFEAVETGVQMKVYLGEMSPENVAAELVIIETDSQNIAFQEFSFEKSDQEGVYVYKTHFQAQDKKTKRLRVRFYPTMKGLKNKFEFGFCTWL